MLVRYVLVSGVCLLIDFSLYLAAIRLGVPAAPAGAVGYMIGAVSHYFLSATFVFQSGRRQFIDVRTVEFSLYIMTALVGTVLTTAIIWLMVNLLPSSSVVAAKIVAIGLTFGTIYLIRARFVMRSASTGEKEPQP